jgi:hypothetical protein
MSEWTREKGTYIALLGMDGIGKTTLSNELSNTLREAARPVQLISWRQYIERTDTQHESFPLEDMRRLWVDSFRLYFGNSYSNEGPIKLPKSYSELTELGGTEYLSEKQLENMEPSGPLNSAWVELTANHILYYHVIRPLTDAGITVIQESFGYKHLLKLFLQVTDLATNMKGQADAGHQFARDYFGLILRPDVGIYVAGDATLAYRWRQQQSGRPGMFEGYAQTGAAQTRTHAADSFLRLQMESAPHFESFARNYGWIRVEMQDVPRDQNLKRAMSTIARNPSGALLGLC